MCFSQLQITEGWLVPRGLTGFQSGLAGMTGITGPLSMKSHPQGGEPDFVHKVSVLRARAAAEHPPGPLGVTSPTFYQSGQVTGPAWWDGLHRMYGNLPHCHVPAQ